MKFDYYHRPVAGSTMCLPTRHWCLLTEIISVGYVSPLQLFVKDCNTQVFRVIFTSVEGSLDVRQCEVGHIIAILYAHIHDFPNGTMGIGQVGSNDCKVRSKDDLSKHMLIVQTIPLRLAELLALSDRVKAAAVSVGGKKACHACEEREDRNWKCARCGLASYCNRVRYPRPRSMLKDLTYGLQACQEKGWKDKGHKADCKILKK